MAPRPMPTAAVANNVQTVDRTVVNLVHSEPRRSMNRLCQLWSDVSDTSGTVAVVIIVHPSEARQRTRKRIR
jgi:hypothetical protein